MKKPSKNAALRRLADLYARMDEAYSACAEAIGLSCAACADNCCESMFRHHTHVEWIYLAQGMAALPAERQQEIRMQAETWLRIHSGALPGSRPRVPCPLAVQGPQGMACGLYEHRPMVCRLHGVPNVLQRPGGQSTAFPGCDRAQQLAKTSEGSLLDRTPLLSDLARLEMDLMGRDRLARGPRVDLTIAEMLLSPPPSL
jgi:Fe-S-cluster containining protein